MVTAVKSIAEEKLLAQLGRRGHRRYYWLVAPRESCLDDRLTLNLTGTIAHVQNIANIRVVHQLCDPKSSSSFMETESGRLVEIKVYSTNQGKRDFVNSISQLNRILDSTFHMHM
jgi:hypothetical protein